MIRCQETYSIMDYEWKGKTEILISVNQVKIKSLGWEAKDRKADEKKVSEGERLNLNFPLSLVSTSIYALSCTVKLSQFHSAFRDVPICTGSLSECNIFSLLFEMNEHCFIKIQLETKCKIDISPQVRSIHSAFKMMLNMRGI